MQPCNMRMVMGYNMRRCVREMCQCETPENKIRENDNSQKQKAYGKTEQQL